MARKNEYRFPARFRRGRTVHQVREPANGQWGGTLEAACGKTGQQNPWKPAGQVTPCRGCTDALATDEQKANLSVNVLTSQTVDR